MSGSDEFDRAWRDEQRDGDAWRVGFQSVLMELSGEKRRAFTGQLRAMFLAGWNARDAVEPFASFVLAYDAWAQSPEHCGGELFEAMLEARDALDPERDGDIDGDELTFDPPERGGRRNSLLTPHRYGAAREVKT